ncbi:MAG: methylornithine synthase PylB [archaeon]|nr:methylornithine synthase PylB [archaeon]
MDAFTILEQCRGGHTPSVKETETLLSCKDPGFEEELFSAASKAREDRFGNRLFIYGFVYFSTFCRNECSFCYYHRTNNIPRYRKSREEVVDLSCRLRDSGVNMVDLTMGEDPQLYSDGCKELIETVRSVRDSIDIGIMVSPGAVPRPVMKELRSAGADWFACYQETYSRDLFGKLRVGQDYQNRIDQRIWAKEAGMLTEDGMLVGAGETVADRAEQIHLMGGSGCQQIRAMTFVPQCGTPMQAVVPHGPEDELRAIAVMRLSYPDLLIPASLDVEGVSGLRARIAAGANVITSIVPPNEELAGVAQPDLDIDDGHRSVDYVRRMISDMGMAAASNNEFREFMEHHRPEASE